MKKVIFMVTVLLVSLIVLSAVGFESIEDLKSNPFRDGVYGKLCVITNLDYDRDVVDVTDWNGDVWSFDGIEDWALWDYVDVVFHDNGTPGTIYDDVIMSTTYERVDLVQAQVLEAIRNQLPQYH